MYQFQQTLPRVPLPRLEETCERYLQFRIKDFFNRYPQVSAFHPTFCTAIVKEYPFKIKQSLITQVQSTYTMSSWIYILLAILLEVVATTCMKLSEGFSKILPSILMFVFYGICFTLLTLAIKKLELGIVYAVWSGLGTVLITAIGIFLLNESASPVKLGAILLIIIGVVILKVHPAPIAVQEEGILSGEGTGISNLETTQPVKTQDILPSVSNPALIMPDSVEYLENEKMPRSR